MIETTIIPELILLITAVLGLLVNLAISIAGQTWARLTSQRYSAVLLPPAGLIITWSISSNLALSLGMIGALSIVRFRTPIKNPFELVIFFSYLIIGISAGVNLKYALWLALIVMLTPVLVKILDVPLSRSRFFGHDLGSKTEFSEDSVQLILQVQSDVLELPEQVLKDAVSSLSFAPVDDEQGFVLDITASFNSLDDAMTCLQKTKDSAHVLHGAVQVLER